eukprot:scaffold1302_cov64-Phaeocystis_antarctica.AAC.6
MATVHSLRTRDVNRAQGGWRPRERLSRGGVSTLNYTLQRDGCFTPILHLTIYKRRAKWARSAVRRGTGEATARVITSSISLYSRSARLITSSMPTRSCAPRLVPVRELLRMSEFTT